MECKLCYKGERWKRFLEPLGVTGCQEGRGRGFSREAGAQGRRMRKRWAWKELEKIHYKYLYFEKQARPRTLFLVRDASDCLFWFLLKPSAWFLSLRIRVSSLVSDEFLWTVPLPRVGALFQPPPYLPSWVLATFGPLGWAATSSYPTQGHSSSTPVPASYLPFTLSGWGLPFSRSVVSVWILSFLILWDKASPALSWVFKI